MFYRFNYRSISGSSIQIYCLAHVDSIIGEAVYIIHHSVQNFSQENIDAGNIAKYITHLYKYSLSHLHFENTSKNALPIAHVEDAKLNRYRDYCWL